MIENISGLIGDLNSEDIDTRLDSLKKLMRKIDTGELVKPVNGGHVNNHIHTTYSFSPYSPAKALWIAYISGLETAGIIDHDSISGAREFIEAGKIIGMATTIGAECRVDFSKTSFNGLKINNPDQNSIAYVTMHGIPHTQIDKVKQFFQPYLLERNNRNKAMVAKINNIVSGSGIYIDFENDVLPLSKFKEGGSVTERHISYSFALKMVEKFGKGAVLIEFLENSLNLKISPKIKGYLLDLDNPYYEYDLLGLVKGEMVEAFYLDAVAECPDVKEFIRFSKNIGAISAYAYLGNIGDSVTGDKKSQKFEDAYLDELFTDLKELGFNGITYMPSRNTMEQLKRVKKLCEKLDFFQISGEDINSPRQSFICKAMADKEFSNLFDSTWALIGHEKAATKDMANGMFTSETITRYPRLMERIEVFKRIGMCM